MKDRNKKTKDQKQQTGGNKKQGADTANDQQQADYGTQGDKGKQQQGNHGSRQGDGGNRGTRGNPGLG